MMSVPLGDPLQPLGALAKDLHAIAQGKHFSNIRFKCVFLMPFKLPFIEFHFIGNWVIFRGAFRGLRSFYFVCFVYCG